MMMMNHRRCLPGLHGECRHVAIRAANASSSATITKPKLRYAGPIGASEGMNPTKSAWTAQLSLPPAPTISKTDDAFLKLGCEFVHAKEGIALSEVNDLFEKVRRWLCTTLFCSMDLMLSPHAGWVPETGSRQAESGYRKHLRVDLGTLYKAKPGCSNGTTGE